jgi:hypothetical protein
MLTDTQADRLITLFTTDIHGEAHVEVEVTSGVYQRMIAAHRENQPRLPRLRAVSSTPED